MIVEPVQLVFRLLASLLVVVACVRGDARPDRSDAGAVEPIDLPTRRHVVPKCVYTVQRAPDAADDAEALTLVTIGDWLHHSWRCSRDETGSSLASTRQRQRTRWLPPQSRESYADGAAEIYCMMVHNCTISSQPSVSDEATDAHRHWRRVPDGADRSGAVELIDEFGCSLHPTVLPNVRYGEDGLSADLRAQAFSLDIDKPAIYFKCNIRLLLKRDGVCRRPVCATAESVAADDKR